MKRTPNSRSADRSPEETSEAALQWASRAGGFEGLAAAVEQQVARSRRRRLASAGAVLACAFAAVFGWQYSSRSAATEPTPPLSYVVASPRTMQLADGSRAELRGDARVRVEYSNAMRRVVLEAGEAHFEVAKHKARPFVVVAGGIEVRAVGTAFSVGLESGSVQVLVTEGTVALERPAAAQAVDTLAQLGAGMRAVVELGDGVKGAPRIDKPAVAPLQAWRAPRLEFSGTPLAEALPLFNRHAALPLELADKSLGNLQLSGALRANDVESLLLFLKHEFGVASEERDGRILLRR